MGKWEEEEQPCRAGRCLTWGHRGRVYGSIDPAALGSQVRPGAPGTTHGREGLVRGRGAPEEPVGSSQSFGGEALKGGWKVGGVHPRVHSGANCAKWCYSAQERARAELLRGEERGALALSDEGPMSPEGQWSTRGKGDKVPLRRGAGAACSMPRNQGQEQAWRKRVGRRERGTRALSNKGGMTPSGHQPAEIGRGVVMHGRGVPEWHIPSAGDWHWRVSGWGELG